jgi:hypothetical protein
MSSNPPAATDWTPIVDGVVTFLAVLLAFVLALWQDRYRERRDDAKQRNNLMDIFSVELYQILIYLRDNQSDIKFPIYYDAWDYAKASGKLALLTREEYGILNSIYVHIRAINHRIEDHNNRLVSRTPGVLTHKESFESRIFQEKGELIEEISEARRKLDLLPETQNVAT